MASPQSERLKVLGAGVIGLVLMLGVARFSYTPLLPLMQQQAGLGVAEGGWLAAINYMGYLSGAVIASLIYLAVQIRQSRDMERAGSIREMFRKGSDMVGYPALHPGSFDVIRRGVADFGQLSAEEVDPWHRRHSRFPS